MLTSGYYGELLSPIVCDFIAKKRIKENVLAKDAALFETKWFDYRHLHPTKATYLFAHHYNEIYKKAMSKHFDKRLGSAVTCISNPQIKALNKELDELKRDRKIMADIVKQQALLAGDCEEKLIEVAKLKAELSQFDATKRNREIEIANLKRVAKNKPIDFLDCQEALGFWKARQAADTLGIPYDYYIRYAFDVLIGDTIWKRIPRPTHLYSKSVIEGVRSKWLAELSEFTIAPTIQYPNDLSEYALYCKSEIERWICNCIGARKNPHLGLAHYVFKLRVVSEAIALEYFDVETIQRAKAEFLESQ